MYRSTNDAPTSVDDESLEAVSVSPLPASTNITVRTAESKPLIATIMNNLGQVVKTFTVINSEQINVADLPVGTYNLLLKDQAQTVSTSPVVISR